MFAEILSDKSKLVDLSVSQPAFPCIIAHPKLLNIPVTHKMFKKLMADCDSSKVYGTDYNLAVVIKSSESEISYTLVDFFMVCSKESCFTDCLKFPCAFLVLKSTIQEDLSSHFQYVSGLLICLFIFWGAS